MMDFTPTERQLAAAQAYKSSSGLRDLPVPEAGGGAGLNVTELGALLTEAGRNADPSVLVLMTGTLPLARWGESDRLGGRPLLAAALREPSHPFPERPAASLTNNEVSGVKVDDDVEHEIHRLEANRGPAHRMLKVDVPAEVRSVG